ncbi:TonB-dependent receptor [Flavitalea flava]
MNLTAHGKVTPVKGRLPAKMLMIMRLTAILLLTATLHVSATGLAQKVTIYQKNARLEEIFEILQKQSGYNFMYNSHMLAKAKKVTIRVTNASVETILALCFKDQPLTYVVQDKIIVVKEKEELKNTTSTAPPVPPPHLSGTVRDENNNPVEGAAITVKSLNTGTVTDKQGKFQLNIPDGAYEVEISFVGYKSEKRTVTVAGGQSPALTITLHVGASGLNEVVVVGYGTQRKRDVTGTISTVKGDDLKNVPVSNPATALQGRASGVDIVRADGSPGSVPTIRIRGTGTLNNADPLVVIDGVPAGTLNDINPNDIASIEILKDASSSAIYGTRAANGVVLVTTKKGSFGDQMKISANLYTGNSKIVKYLDLLKAPDLAPLKLEAYTNDGVTSGPSVDFWSDQANAIQRTDWQKALFGTGKTNNADLAIRGGNASSSYSFSANYYDEKGLIINSNFKRYSARINSEHKLSNRIRVGENFLYSKRSGSSPDTRSTQTGLVWSALRFNPSIPVFVDSTGKWGSSKGKSEQGDINNPVFTATTNDISLTNNNLLTNAYIEIDLLKGLKIRGNIGYDQEVEERYEFYPASPDQTRVQQLASLKRQHQEYSSLLNEIYLTYNGQFGKDHSLIFTGGYSAQTSKGYYYYGQRTGFTDTDPNQIVLNNGNGANQFSGGGSDNSVGSNTPTGLLSYFVRGNYSFKGKYLLTGTMRADGSGKFPPGKRWGYFPAFSLGWRISDENFFKNNITFLNNLKLTGGWGQLGNQNVNDFQFLGILQNGGQYAFGAPSNVVNASFITSLSNPNITWERAEMTNISAEFGLLGNHLTGTVTYFNKNTRDMLVPASIVETYGAAPSIYGNVSVPDQNQGILNNHGVEIDLTYQNTSGKLSYAFGVNGSFINNKVTHLYGTKTDYIGSVFYGRESLETSRTYEGQPIASFYGFKTNGLYQTQGDIDKEPGIANDPNKANILPGDVRFVDINGDGIIDDKDRVNLGNPNPKFTFGFHGNLAYKGFDLSFNFAGQTGSKLYNADRMVGLDGTQFFNMYEEARNRWHGAGTSNSVPRLSKANLNVNNRSSDLWIQSGNYISLKTVALGYTFPKTMIGTLQIPESRIYVSGYNVFMLTGYKGYSPELGYTQAGNNRQRGVDVAQYPSARSITVGATFNF